VDFGILGSPWPQVTLTGSRDRVQAAIPTEQHMTIARLLAVALLACALCGCQALKDDPITGDQPWQPGLGKTPNR